MKPNATPDFDKNHPDRAAASLAAHAHALFASAGEHIDGDTLRRLRAARVAALSTPRRRNLLPVLVPAGALAAAALALAVVWHPLRPPASAPATAGAGTLLASADSSEVDMAQNLDFYDWLATQPQPAQATQATSVQ
ncbi:MAG: hypothetical protein M0P72_04520 [Metallibacterium scheffleri]|jgi:hypothetical protein|uniref:hypothetical protein n=1 Tax=Metallibacterium scheffleri TaxID=993689 RepID=UPI0026EC7E77|nr:hypothetical protein [Metallibacterium scheffleri]MCK9366398.1 hypothetical protein [Metallibacterium scheffleri]